MGRIHQLSPQVIARIAAGEVIERPASVVKELLENSLDAGATRIDIDVSQGGIESIRVVDNGGGLEPDDLPLALATHATSKLRDESDLFRISTLGFRGEGLASIGGVARVVLQSRPGGSRQGAEIQCHGGELSEVRPWNGTPGTRIEVRHLFYNVPARRRFLRGPSTELGHISEVFTRVALSQLSVHLCLRHNNRVLHDVAASAGLLDRIERFFGDEVRRRLHPVEAEQHGLTLGGYVADPVCERGGTQMQYLFVNGRWIRDRVVSQALQEAYRGLLMTGKYPVSFLYLDVPPDEVDINVHPTKSEVRFRQPDRVRQLVMKAVRDRLGGQDLTPPLRVREAPVEQPEQRELPTVTGLAQPLPIDLAKTTVRPGQAPKPDPHREPPKPALPGPERKERPKELPPRAFQLHNLYLVVEVTEGMLLIDQHALHERILFEQLKERLAQGKPEVQKLLVPDPVALTPTQSALVMLHKDALADLGIEVEEFSPGNVFLLGYPALLGKRSPREILQGVADYLAGKEQPPSREALLNDLLALVACHSAVRGGDRLNQEEIDALVAQRELARDAHHCPHGRPSSLLFTTHDLERQFRRV